VPTRTTDRKRSGKDLREPPHAAIDTGRRVAWFTLESLTAAVGRAGADGSVARTITKITRADLIMIDDIGMLPAGQAPPKRSIASSTPPTSAGGRFGAEAGPPSGCCRKRGGSRWRSGPHRNEYERAECGLRAGGSVLVLNWITLWNTVYLDTALGQPRDEGYPVRDERRAALGLPRRHLNVHGHYSFQLPDLAGPAARCATPIPATTKSTDPRRSTGADLLSSRLAVADAPAPSGGAPAARCWCRPPRRAAGS